MGRREKIEIYDTGENKENLLRELPPPHRIFFAVFQQAERDIEDFAKLINSGKVSKILTEQGWNNKLFKDYNNLKESLAFFSNKDDHFKSLADCANVDLSNRQYKERIKINIETGRAAQDKLRQVEDQVKSQAIKHVPVILSEIPGLPDVTYAANPSVWSAPAM